jgi:hypothetical protein
MEKTKSFGEETIADILIEKGARIFTLVLYFTGSFILSGAELLSIKAPLSIALAAACTGGELIAVTAGGMLGAIFRLSGNARLCGAIPLAGIAAVVFILDKNAIRKNRRRILSISVFAFCFVCNTAVMFAERYDCDALYTSKVVAVSTILSIATMPLVIFLAGLGLA